MNADPADAPPSDAEPLVLDEAEVRRVVRLLADALAPDDGRAAKVGRLMDGLAAMTGADGWFWLRSRVKAGGGSPVNIDFLYGGDVDSAKMGAWADRSMEIHGVPPEHGPMRARLAEGRHFTMTRADCVPDAAWRTPANLASLRPVGFEEILYSWLPLAEAGGDFLLSGCVLLRKPGSPPFDARAARLSHLIWAEAHPLHTLGLDATLADTLAPLSPRARQVLALLVDGQSVKQVAYQLGLSPHTVNDHCKAIHRRFGVNSRGELLRRFMTGKT